MVSASKRRRGRMAMSSKRTWGKVKAGDFPPQLDLLPDQEMMSQEGQRQMVVPATPAADFIVVHPQLVFALANGQLDGPAHPEQPDQGAVRRVGGGIAQ